MLLEGYVNWPEWHMLYKKLRNAHIFPKGNLNNTALKHRLSFSIRFVIIFFYTLNDLHGNNKMGQAALF